MHKRTIWSILLACCAWLTAAPVVAQTESERVEIILSGLSSQDSAAYRAIRELAGRASGQVLTLTKTEMWSIPRGNLKAVSRRAARHGVRLRHVGADWNLLFHSVPGDTRFSEKQKALLEGAATSEATLGVAVMETPAPPIVEYALTKGTNPNLPPTSANAAKIIVRLNKATVLTIRRSTVEIVSNTCIWRGRVDGTGAPVTLMWWPSGKLAGTIRHNGRIYSIRHIGGQLHAVIEMRKDRMPPTHAPAPQRTRVDERDGRRV
jgi:hypothetical protein